MKRIARPECEVCIPESVEQCLACMDEYTAELEKKLAERDEMLKLAKDDYDVLALRVAQLCTINCQPACIALWRDVARETIQEAQEEAEREAGQEGEE